MNARRDGDRATTTRPTVQTSITTRPYPTAHTEVLARIRFAESLALRSAIGLDGLDRGDVLIAIAETLAIAERWAVAS